MIETTKKLNIYVASSWRNLLQPGIVLALRRCGHVVYDFKNPAPGNKGFAWSDIDPNWQSWTPDEYRAALQHPIAKKGYALDIDALKACDACGQLKTVIDQRNAAFNEADKTRALVLKLCSFSEHSPEALARARHVEDRAKGRQA